MGPRTAAEHNKAQVLASLPLGLEKGWEILGLRGIWIDQSYVWSPTLEQVKEQSR